MAKNANFVSHKKSKQIIDGKPKLPLASDIVEGEIAVNFGKDVETLSIKNESGDVVTFSSDNYYTEQKLGSGFTGENSGRTVTEALENMEITVDQVLDDTTSASTNPVSSKAVYKAATDNELVWTNAFVALSGTVSAHTENTEIHVTAADKEKLHTHSNKTALDSITGNVGTMAYEDKSSYSSATEVNTALVNKANTSDLDNFFDDAKYENSGTTKVINFYHGDSIKATIDASDFIVDGMVDDVRIENGNLVIDFNTASGKQDISIPLTNIFDPSNYYDKTAIDNLVGSGFTSSSITDVIIENEEIVSAALTDLDERKLDASAYTPTDLSNYYTKSETSGATELQTAFSAKANTATTLAGYGITDAYTKSETSGATEISNAFDAVNTSITDLSGQSETVSVALNYLNENKADLSAVTPVDLSNYYTKSETSGATELTTALASKSDTGHTHASSGVTAMTGYAKAASGSSIATGDTLNQAIGKLEAYVDDLNSQSETVATALVNLNTNKLDATAYTPTDLSNYYTKSQTSGASEISAALADKIASGDVVTEITSSNSGSTAPISVKVVAENKYVVSTALNDLYDKIGDIEDILATI